MAMLGAIAATASTATAAVVNTIAPAKPNKYAEAIRLFDLMVEARDDKALLHTRADQLFVHLRENFPVPEPTDQHVSALANVLNSPIDQDGLRGIPPNVADEIYPVALARMGLLDCQLPLQPTLMTEFDWFHVTYGRLIISASDRRIKMPKVL
jgi:hypothetical protein